jgi:hypothetical protein
MVSPKKPRGRTARREAERALRRGIVDRERLVGRAPGGSPDRAIPVTSASVVEVQAAATPCVQCGGELLLQSHAAPPEGGGSLRVARLVCRRCHAPREIWFRLELALPS